jgi:hypothetical protein
MDPTPKSEPLMDLLGGKQVKIEAKTPETAVERKARILRETEDAAFDRVRKKADEDHERRKDFILFVFSLVIVAGSALFCVLAIVLSPANTTWAVPLLTLIVGGLLGYQTGKSQGSKSAS